MKKETIIAIVFGIFFGAVIASLIHIKNKQSQLSNNKTIIPSTTVSKTDKNIQSVAQGIKITQPENYSIVDTESVVIKGSAEKDSLIVAQSPTKDLVIKNSKDNFSINFPLSLGENIIIITVYPKDPQIRVQENELRIYYLKE
jgi:hypothetical protein